MFILKNKICKNKMFARITTCTIIVNISKLKYYLLPWSWFHCALYQVVGGGGSLYEPSANLWHTIIFWGTFPKIPHHFHTCQRPLTFKLIKNPNLSPNLIFFSVKFVIKRPLFSKWWGHVHVTSLCLFPWSVFLIRKLIKEISHICKIGPSGLNCQNNNTGH